jgi:hypothetical protein
MVTHYPHEIASERRFASGADAHQAVEGIVARGLTWLRQAFCGLGGHDNLMHFEKDRMYLRCVSCGRETPGWELSELPKPTMRLRGDARRHALARPHLVSARRIA